MTKAQLVERTKNPMNVHVWVAGISIPHARERLEAATRYAETSGWHVEEASVREKLSARYPGSFDDATGIQAVTDHQHRDITINTGMSVDRRLYSLLHEIGHTFHDPVRPTSEEEWLFKMGILQRHEVASVIESEVQAELFVSLVLEHWGVDPNWDYLRGWGVTEKRFDRWIREIEWRVQIFLDAMSKAVPQLTFKEVAA